jgi:DNA modification methylase
MDSNQVIYGRCEEVLKEYPEGSVDLLFADPPFNIGLAYDRYQDHLPYNDYLGFTDNWLSACNRVLKPTGSAYVAIGDEMAAEVCIAMKKLGWVQRNWCIWAYGFGQHSKHKFGRSHTHILYFTKSSTEWVWNGDDILVPSLRATKYGDKRAKDGGRVPPDIFEESYTESDMVPLDVWRVSRLCGTFKERVKRQDGSVHPCQMPLSILERIIKASSNRGDLVLDPFCGTGTTAVAAQTLGRRYLTMDVSEEYVEVAKGRLGFGKNANPNLCC